jgi:glycosyltransferase involved in cell wall biosynthesis
MRRIAVENSLIALLSSMRGRPALPTCILSFAGRNGGNVSGKRIIALVGRRDEPTDGVWDYCTWLGGSLTEHGFQFETVRINWLERGWRAALAELKINAKSWSGGWVLLQYTALAWSKRGFPIRVPGMLLTLKQMGIRCGVVFHDFNPFGGTRIIDRTRTRCQRMVLRRMYAASDLAIFSAPVQKVTWLRTVDPKAVFIPIGANCPEPTGIVSEPQGQLTVAVFCVTCDHRMAKEVRDIGHAVRHASRALGPLRLIVLGRGSKEADAMLQAEFSGTDVQVSTLGLLPADEVSHVLARSSVLLFVRGEISSRRGSAIAGIACGLPIVGYESVDTAWPLTEAGLVLVPEGNSDALSKGLLSVLSDAALRQSLRARSRQAQQHYFSWTAIARRVGAAVGGARTDLTDHQVPDIPAKQA